MAEIVNLRQARKRAARDAAASKADANRTAFGLPKAMRELAKAERAMTDVRLDGRLLDTREAGHLRAAPPATDNGSSD